MNRTPSRWIAFIGGIIGGIVLAVVACPVGSSAAVS
jgi:hypothetical protein